MPIPRLEVFETDTPQPAGAKQIVTTDLASIEEAKLAAYEQGFQAGWDDAVAAQSEDIARIRADLGRNLQALSFTYHEARAHVLGALEPLLIEVVGRILPETSRETLAPMVVERLMPLAEAGSDQPVTLVLNPVSRAAVERLTEGLVADATGLPLRIEEEPSLGEGQAFLRLGAEEARIDLGRTTHEIATAVRAFFTLLQEPPSDG
ncbi:flagellar biosynthesis protein [Pseudogemmobacter sonorensis]|uniref:FliH/SctL family protein n=1 Tax=Pseudogemmobacter sonorensis TaxID=2989681 RepID=UPI0036A7489B